MAKTRIGLGCLSKDGFGSVELPDDAALYCPQCGTECADKGQCLASFTTLPDTEEFKTMIQVGLLVDCRTCGCYGKAPSLYKKD